MVTPRLTELMQIARWRVVAHYLVLSATLLWVTPHISIRGPLQPIHVVNIVAWAIGCGLILIAGWVWVRA
jgi:hypothetical protein